MAVKQLTPQQAHDLMQKDSTILYLDVRTEPEFTAGHPHKGVNIPAFFFQAPGRPAESRTHHRQHDYQMWSYSNIL